MDGGCHHRGPVPLGRLDDDPPGLAERHAHLGHRTAHAGIGLDLGAQKLAHHPMWSALLFAGFENALVRVDEEVAGFGIDQEELLLDPESDCRVSPCSRRRSRPGLRSWNHFEPFGRRLDRL